MIMNMFMFKAAIVLMLIIIVREILRRKFNIDMDKIDIKNLKNFKNFKNTKAQTGQKDNAAVVKNTGDKTVILTDSGANKATVMATLRQITGYDYNTARNLVYSTPSTVMSKVSDKEADLTKKALEFVGATVEVK